MNIKNSTNSLTNEDINTTNNTNNQPSDSNNNNNNINSSSSQVPPSPSPSSPPQQPQQLLPSAIRQSQSHIPKQTSFHDFNLCHNPYNEINPFADTSNNPNNGASGSGNPMSKSGGLSKSRSGSQHEIELGSSSSNLKKSKSMESVEFITEPQIPLYYSMVKEKERQREVKLRNRIKNKLKKNRSNTTTTTTTTDVGASPSTIEPIDGNDKEPISAIDLAQDNIEKKTQHKPKDLATQTTEELTHDHTLPLEELIIKLKTNININDPRHSFGLSREFASERLEIDGKNALTPSKPVPKWVKYLKEFLGLFPIMLEVGGILSIIAFGIDTETGKDNLYLGIILWIVVFLTCTFSYIQNSKSSGVMEGFKKLAPSSTKVLRDDNLIEIDSEDLVVGDVVIVRAGDKVPADLRVIASHHFKVDNASLTGETEPQTRSPNCTDENPLETQNLTFYGTLACQGDCVGVVIATGDRTVIGKIAKLASNSKPNSTPMKEEIEKFIKIISIVAFSLGAIFLAIGFGRSVEWILVIIYTIGIVVSQVPEALLPTLTVTLNLTAKRMSKKNVLVKNLLTVETLGSTTTIASDKTGTLTQNIMTVVHLWYDGTIYSCNSLTASNFFNAQATSFKKLYQVAALCNRTVFDKSENQDDIPIQLRKCIGDASESALLKFCEQVENVEQYRDRFPKYFEIPFNSVNKWQMSVHTIGDDGEFFMVMKGAPERIIKMCNRILIEGEEQELDEKHLQNFQSSYEHLAGKGERVLGLAYLPLDPQQYPNNYIFDMEEKNFPTKDLVFVGLTALMDPPRPGVPEAIRTCKEAGIRVMMVTGDHPLTGTAIAKQVGIIETDETLNDIAEREGVDVLSLDFSRGTSIAITGSMLDDLTSEQWDKILSLRELCFCRTSPEQKLQIVAHLQKRGEIVAVTGDGVNDSPALKKADLGCAMGITGSDVAKEAASIVLLDDNFASIIAGVEEGRMIFDKLKKSICYTLSSNIPEAIPFFCFFVLQMPVALSGILILCIDLGTDLIPVISYAYEGSETDLMKRKPRNVKKDKLVSLRLAVFSYLWLGCWQCAAGFLNYFLLFKDYGYSASDLYNVSSTYFKKDAPLYGGHDDAKQIQILNEAQTAYFIAIVISRVGACFCAKTRIISIFQQGFSNMVFNFGVCSMLAIALFIVHVPGVRTFFGCTIVSYKYWLIPIPFAVFLVASNELRLWLIRRYPNSTFANLCAW
ncbi:hypothetical protein ACTFIR_005375 [Dictyostelium discoideum]